MTSDQNAINTHVYKGRRQILTNISKIDKETIPVIINNSLAIHRDNQDEIIELEKYYLGDQQILYRSKEQRPDINNTIVINNAYATTRIINGIAYGNQVQIVPRNKENLEEVNKFNEFCFNESKHLKDMEISTWQSICGVAYLLVLPNKVNQKSIPFKSYVLNPKTTFCVYSNTIDRKRVLGVTYLYNYDSDGVVESITYNIYTKNHTYTYTTKEADGTIDVNDFVKNALDVPRMYSNKVPLVECMNDMFSQGDWEMTISLMDSINLLTSDRLNQFVQNVCYIYKMVNCEFEEGITNIWDVIDKGYIQLKTGGDLQNKAEFDILSAPLDQTDIEKLANYLQDKFELVVGIPNRQSRGGGGGDTGEAVFLRNGLDDTHTRIAIKHAFRIASEMEIAELKIEIAKAINMTKLNPMEIDVKITPVRHDNSQQTAQALQTYDGIGYPKEDALSLLNLTQDPTSLAIKWSTTQKEKQDSLTKDTQNKNDIPAE